MTASYDEGAALFRAMGHPVRLQILNMLRGGEVCVCHMETAFDRRQAYISQQLMVLREAGLIAARKDGLKVFYRLADPRVDALVEMALGLQHVGEPEALDSCPCPHCATARMEIA